MSAPRRFCAYVVFSDVLNIQVCINVYNTHVYPDYNDYGTVRVQLPYVVPYITLMITVPSTPWKLDELKAMLFPFVFT